MVHLLHRLYGVDAPGAWSYLAEKKFDDIFSHFDTIRECDRQTDGQTPVDG